jgi:hypothetical protein
MDKELSLTIQFSKNLSEKEQEVLLDSLIEEIERMDLRAGGGNYSDKLDWIIDFSDSKLDKGKIIDRLGDFLLSKDELILNFKIG